MVSTATLKQRAKKKLSGNWWTATLVVGFLSSVGLITGLIVGALRQPLLDRADAFLDSFLQTGGYVYWYDYINATLYSTIYNGINLIATVFQWLFSLPAVLFFISLTEGKKASFKDFSAGFPRAGESFVLYLLMAVKIFLWTLLFIIPGIVKTFSYMLAPMIKAKNPQRTANECIAESCRLMNGNKASCFVLFLSFIGWFILIGLAELGAGVIPVIGSYGAAFVGVVAGCVLVAYMQTTLIEFYREVVSPTPLYAKPAPVEKPAVFDELKPPKEDVFDELKPSKPSFGDFYDAPAETREKAVGSPENKTRAGDIEDDKPLGPISTSGTSYAAQQQKKDDRDER